MCSVSESNLKAYKELCDEMCKNLCFGYNNFYCIIHHE